MTLRGIGVACVVCGLLVALTLPTFERETVLPNGFVIRGTSVVLAADRRTILASDAEFLCFDDRFLVITSMNMRALLILDRLDPVPSVSMPQTLPKGVGNLLRGADGCNGYYTQMIGPGLLHDGGEWPFLPQCDSVNRNNATLKQRDWFERPCDGP